MIYYMEHIEVHPGELTTFSGGPFELAPPGPDFGLEIFPAGKQALPGGGGGIRIVMKLRKLDDGYYLLWDAENGTGENTTIIPFVLEDE